MLTCCYIWFPLFILKEVGLPIASLSIIKITVILSLLFYNEVLTFFTILNSSRHIYNFEDPTHILETKQTKTWIPAHSIKLRKHCLLSLVSWLPHPPSLVAQGSQS